MESMQLNLFQKTDSTGAQEIRKQIEIIEALLIFKSAKKENNGSEDNKKEKKERRKKNCCTF